MKKLFLAIAPAILLAACAVDQAATTSTEPAADKVYRTGSNIPRKDGGSAQTVSPEEMERMRDAASANMGRGRGN
jgi:hypothetical protein